MLEPANIYPYYEGVVYDGVCRNVIHDLANFPVFTMILGLFWFSDVCCQRAQAPRSLVLLEAFPERARGASRFVFFAERECGPVHSLVGPVVGPGAALSRGRAVSHFAVPPSVLCLRHP